MEFVVNCETQEEGDELWEELSEGGEEGQDAAKGNSVIGLTVVHRTGGIKPLAL
jgi:hypothetical protein